MKNKLLLLSTIFILLIINCQAQDQCLIDSLELQLKNHTAKKTELGLKSLSLYASIAINILYHISYAYFANNPEKSIEYANQVLSLSE
jgi:hypothetical protein